MTVCYFGDFDLNYARNRVIVRGLKENGVEVLICHTKEKSFFRKLSNLRNQLRAIRSFDFVIVGYSNSRAMVPLAKILTRKKVVWDAFYSIYDTIVWDRSLVSPWSLKAAYYWLADWFSCRLATKILLDTQEHARYFSKTFFTNRKKIISLFVGSDDTVFYPRDITRSSSQDFLVHFHGNYVPLQGVEVIVGAALYLKDHPHIQFEIVGDGQTYNQIQDLFKKSDLNNIRFIDKVSLEELANQTANADVCLGIFGSTKKAKRVIPNKVYESIAMRKAVITADTPAIQELFQDRENILLSKSGDPRDLADKILELANNNQLLLKIAEGGYEIFKKEATPAVLGDKLLTQLALKSHLWRN